MGLIMKDPTKELEEIIKERNKRAKKSPYLKLRENIICDCNRRKTKEKDRAKFGTCSCDSYSMSFTLAIVISNYIYQYLAECKEYIIREDWDILEQCAKDIRKYVKADSWDSFSKNRKVKSEYKKKEIAFKKSMKYLVDNWQALWW